MRLLIVIAALGLSLCQKDETVGAYGASDRVWDLREIDGAEVTARTTLIFPEPGKIAGDGPCNRYSGVMTTPYPWFDVGQVVSTRVACPELTAETVYFQALREMSEAEVSGNVLILRNEDGREMVFRSGV